MNLLLQASAQPRTSEDHQLAHTSSSALTDNKAKTHLQSSRCNSSPSLQLPLSSQALSLHLLFSIETPTGPTGSAGPSETSLVTAPIPTYSPTGSLSIPDPVLRHVRLPSWMLLPQLPLIHGIIFLADRLVFTLPCPSFSFSVWVNNFI